MKDRIEMTNTDQNKALFEYEMTEVLLQLKGEFAVFSGKNTKFAESDVDDQLLVVNIAPLPDAVISVPESEVPAIPNGDVAFCAQVPAVENKTAVPQIPNVAPPPSFQVDAVAPALNEAQNALLDQAAKIVLPSAGLHEVTIPCACGVKVPAIPGKDSLPGSLSFAPEYTPPKAPDIKLPESMSFAPLPEVRVSMEHQIPDISPMPDFSQMAAGLHAAAPAKYQVPDSLKLPQSVSVHFDPTVRLPAAKQNVPQVGRLHIPFNAADGGEQKPRPKLPPIPNVPVPAIREIAPVQLKSAPHLQIPKVEKVSLSSWNAQEAQTQKAP